MSSHDTPPQSDSINPADSTKPAETKNAGGAVIGGLILLVGLSIVIWTSGARLPTVLPENIGTYTAVDTLFWAIFGLNGFFFLLTEGLLIFYCVKYRAKEGGRAEYSHGNHALELTWTFIPGLILFVLAVAQTGLWSDLKYTAEMPGADENPLVVQVIGRQFEWHFRYPGPDNEFGTADDVTSPFQLHIPKDRWVIVRLQTLDVLHSFWLPNVRLKQDLVPGQTIPQWFMCVTGGDYEIVCAELCGSGHTKMRGELHVHSTDEFDAWMKKQAKSVGEHVPEKDPHWKHWQEKAPAPAGEKASSSE